MLNLGFNEWTGGLIPSCSPLKGSKISGINKRIQLSGFTVALWYLSGTKEP